MKFKNAKLTNRLFCIKGQIHKYVAERHGQNDASCNRIWDANKKGEEGSGTEQKGGTSSVVQENETLFSPWDFNRIKTRIKTDDGAKICSISRENHANLRFFFLKFLRWQIKSDPPNYIGDIKHSKRCLSRMIARLTCNTILLERVLYFSWQWYATIIYQAWEILVHKKMPLQFWGRGIPTTNF